MALSPLASSPPLGLCSFYHVLSDQSGCDVFISFASSDAGLILR